MDYPITHQRKKVIQNQAEKKQLSPQLKQEYIKEKEALERKTQMIADATVVGAAGLTGGIIVKNAINTHNSFGNFTKKLLNAANVQFAPFKQVVADFVDKAALNTEAIKSASNNREIAKNIGKQFAEGIKMPFKFVVGIYKSIPKTAKLGAGIALGAGLINYVYNNGKIDQKYETLNKAVQTETKNRID